MDNKSEKELWEQEFKAAMQRPLATRIRYSFIKTYKPVLDDATYRSLNGWPIIVIGVKLSYHRGWDMAAFEYRQAEELREVHHQAFVLK